MSYLMIYRFSSVKKIFSDIENRFQLREKGLAYSQFIQLILSILIVAHYSASIFHNIAQVQYEQGATETWLKSQADYHSPWLERYIISLYWSVITIITIGYGDITPKTQIERTYVILFTFIGCGLFGYCINVIGEQVREIGRDKSLFKRKSAKLNKFMSLRGLNKDLQQKVSKYFEYLFNEQMNEEEEGSNIFNNLTTLLKKQVWIDVYGKLLKQKPIFMANFSGEFINMLSLKVKEKKFGPEEYIFVDGDSANYIFIIISGEVDQFLQRDATSDQYQSQPKLHFINSFKKGEMFGQLEFFSQTKRRSTIKTRCVTSVAYLNYNDFLEVVSLFETDREKYYQIKDQILMYKNYSNIDLKCPICSEYRHCTQECNSVNFIIYKEKVIKNAISSEEEKYRRNRSIIQKELQFQKSLKKGKSIKGSVRNIADRTKFHALLYSIKVKEQGFQIIVDALAEQIQETLSRDDDNMFQQMEYSSEEIEDEQIQQEQQQQQLKLQQLQQQQQQQQQQQEISVSEDLEQQQNGSDYDSIYNSKFQSPRDYQIKQNSYFRKLSAFKNRTNSITDNNNNNIHVEVSADQEESLQNMPNCIKDSRKKTYISLEKVSEKSILTSVQDNEKKIELCRSQQSLVQIDYMYAVNNNINLYQIPFAYVLDEHFRFPQEVVNSIPSQMQKSVQFPAYPSRTQHQISATLQPQKTNRTESLTSSNSIISPTIFQQPQTTINSFRLIDLQRNNNSNYASNTNININNNNNTNNNNQSNHIAVSPSNILSSGNYNFSNQTNYNNQSNYNNANFIHTNTAYSASPLNQTNSNNTNSPNYNSFGTAVNLYQQNQNVNYNNMITQNTFAPQYNPLLSPYNNRLGTYGMYLPALIQQLEPINELQSKEILSSDEEDEGDKSSAKKSSIGNKTRVNNIRRRSKEPSINLHMKSNNQNKDGLSSIGGIGQGTNSQYIGSAGTIATHHMDVISPQRVPQHLSQESIQIQRGFSSEQDSVNQDENYLSVGNGRNKNGSMQHVQFAEDEEQMYNNSNTITTFEQTQNNGTSTGKHQKKQKNTKLSQFANNHYIYNSFNSQISSMQYPNQTNIFPNSQSTNYTNNTILPKNGNNNNNTYYQQQSTLQGNNNNTAINIHQGSSSVLGTAAVINATNFQNQMLLANNGYSSQCSWQYDPSSLYSKLMSRQSVQFKFKKDQDFCALIYKKNINLKAIDKVYEDIFNNFDQMKNYTKYFWHNNFKSISLRHKGKLFRRKLQSTATQTNNKKSKTFDGRNRTSVLFQLSRANSNMMQHQTSIFTSNKPSLASLSHVPRHYDKPVIQKTIQI